MSDFQCAAASNRSVVYFKVHEKIKPNSKSAKTIFRKLNEVI